MLPFPLNCPFTFTFYQAPLFTGFISFLHSFPLFSDSFFFYSLSFSVGLLCSSPNLSRAVGADKTYLVFGVFPSILLALEHLLQGQDRWGQQIQSGKLFVYGGFDRILMPNAETHTLTPGHSQSELALIPFKWRVGGLWLHNRCYNSGHLWEIHSPKLFIF